jgi:hypothetical protein
VAKAPVPKPQVASAILASAEIEKTDPSIEEIDARVRAEGFPELRWLWRKFRRLGVRLADVDDEQLQLLRLAHTGALSARPVPVALISVVVALTTFAWHVPRGQATSAAKIFLAGVTSALFVYVFWFVAAFVQRSWIHPWKRISALELAAMLRRRNFRDWFDRSPGAVSVVERLRMLGVNANWDSADYRARYRTTGGRIERVEVPSPREFLLETLREVLGSKQERRFQPGRYIDSLRERKRSVTRFVNAHQERLRLNHEGKLEIAEGIALLRELRADYLMPDSPGAKFVEDRSHALERGDLLPTGVVEAKIWDRDPWQDLTHQQEFFSSASLRGNRPMDVLSRRSKGTLGPFGYLRNKSISALDLRTREGRSVRVRLAAATFRSGRSDRPVLFVDGVEGRFDIKPRLIRTAIEDYARASGFELVFYYGFPLNQVPRRFVRHVRSTGVRTEQLTLRYLDSSQREYLDAFGLPLEPFEYAFPRGRVLGCAVALDEGLQREIVVPSQWTLRFGQVRDRAFLWLLSGASLVCLGWTLWLYEPAWLLPASVLFGAAVAYDVLLQRRSVRRERRSEDEADPRLPRFLCAMRKEVEASPLAREADASTGVEGKIRTLQRAFPGLDRHLRFFFEAVLYNVSLKDSELTSLLRFHHKLSVEQREVVQALVAAVWPRGETDGRTLLSGDQGAAKAARKQLAARMDAIRRCVKKCRLTRQQVRQIVAARRALHMDILDVLEIVTVRPRILRGLWKPPRPVFAWTGPVAVALVVMVLLTRLAPGLSALSLFLILMGIIVPGVYVVSTRLAIAPGILCYEKTRRHLSAVLARTPDPGTTRAQMESLGIDTAEFADGRVYEDRVQGTRIVIRDKRTPDGSVHFLTSSEGIANCIALRNFVSWTLPSYLRDDSIQLADVYYRGSQSKYAQRAQVWMIAAEEAGVPVLVVNSFEFNNEGAKHLGLLMEHSIRVIQDVAVRAGFERIYAGISDYGRAYLDRHFTQAEPSATVKKVHAVEAGYRYHFDVFRLRWSLGDSRPRRAYVYARRRVFAARVYALIFGFVEFVKGNRAKALAFWDTVVNTNNMWEIPVPHAERPCAAKEATKAER